jgi:hypothetical protein
MAIKSPPEIDEIPPLETSPRRSGGWLRRLQRRIKLAFAGDDEELVLKNETGVAWRVYHNYRQLGIIDPDERRIFRLVKHGSLSVRPWEEGTEVEYLVLSLSANIQRVRIYRRHMAKDIEVYDMSVA